MDDLARNELELEGIGPKDRALEGLKSIRMASMIDEIDDCINRADADITNWGSDLADDLVNHEPIDEENWQAALDQIGRVETVIQNATLDSSDDSDADRMVDLLTNLMHYCEWTNTLDAVGKVPVLLFDDLVDRARIHFNAEDEDKDEAEPDREYDAHIAADDARTARWEEDHGR